MNCLAFSPDGKQLASCAADRFIKLWNVADGKFVRSFEGHTHHVLGVAWRADGRVLVSSGADMVLKVWDTRTRRPAPHGAEPVHQGSDERQLRRRRRLVVASGGDAKVRFINATNGSNQRDFGGTTEYMYSVAASADGKTIVAGGLDSVAAASGTTTARSWPSSRRRHGRRIRRRRSSVEQISGANLLG